MTKRRKSTKTSKIKVEDTVDEKTVKTDDENEEADVKKGKLADEESEMKTATPPELWFALAIKALGQSVAQKAVNSSKFIGAHVSIAGDLAEAPIRAAETGCRAFGLFLRNQRTWKTSPLDLEVAGRFRQNCQRYNFSPKHILPHGSYLLNVGSPNEETRKKSRDLLLHEVQRCETLALPMYNFHPGSSCGKMTVEECLTLIADAVDFVHQQTSNVTLVLETMAGQGSTVGSFQELKEIINKVTDKSRVGVCLDSCHVFAAGHDVSNQEGYDKMMKEFEDVVGLEYLKAIHLNDSKGICECHADRHENIGKGKIGLNGFKCFMNDARLTDLPIILETPMGLSDSEEIQILYDL